MALTAKQEHPDQALLAACKHGVQSPCVGCAEEELTERITRACFEGATYDEKKDKIRLARQLLRIFAIMADRQWHTLMYLANATGCSDASASARLRDLRKQRFGHFNIERRRHAALDGVHEYRLAP